MERARSRIPKASDVIITEVREKILFERLPVGARLSDEATLMEQYGLGRVTVREALRVLEQEGFVEMRRGPAGGVFVRHADISQVSDAMALLLRFRETTLGESAEFRALVEPRVAHLAALHATDEQRVEIERLAEDGAGPEQVAGLHGLLTAACGNGVLETTLKALHDSHAGHHRYDLHRLGSAVGTEHDHRAIAHAVVVRDGVAAESAMRSHLARYDAYLHDQGLVDVSTVPAVGG